MCSYPTFLLQDADEKVRARQELLQGKLGDMLNMMTRLVVSNQTYRVASQACGAAQWLACGCCKDTVVAVGMVTGCSQLATSTQAWQFLAGNQNVGVYYITKDMLGVGHHVQRSAVLTC